MRLAGIGLLATRLLDRESLSKMVNSGIRASFLHRPFQLEGTRPVG